MLIKELHNAFYIWKNSLWILSSYWIIFIRDSEIADYHALSIEVKTKTQSDLEILQQIVLWILKFRAKIQSLQILSYTLFSLLLKKSTSTQHHIF